MAVDDRRPDEVERGKSAIVGHAHDADEVVAADVGGHDASADHPPGQLVAGQKVVAIGLLASLDRPDAQRQHGRDIDDEDRRNPNRSDSSSCRYAHGLAWDCMRHDGLHRFGAGFASARADLDGLDHRLAAEAIPETNGDHAVLAAGCR